MYIKHESCNQKTVITFEIIVMINTIHFFQLQGWAIGISFVIAFVVGLIVIVIGMVILVILTDNLVK